eukprot:jgi/Astpho2/6989/e_gw1.00107.198.1_t
MPCIKVLFFARAKELAGTDQAELNLADGVNSDDLLHLLFERYPGLQEIKDSTVLSLNLEYIQPGDKKVLQPRDEVAVIPPISGG